ncbi:hypothetical protein EDC96DRAFT_574658 [Choanephora cucurbitarum]|nr:hypothetical protein EDC96DRAFT_574658 [Choanephora cucurbitarum]
MRQRDDHSFAVALNNMAVESMTPIDISLIQICVLKLTTRELRAFNATATTNRNGSNSYDNNISLSSLPLPHLDITRRNEAYTNANSLSSSSTSEQSRGICRFKTNVEVQKANDIIFMFMEAEGAVSIAFDRVTGMVANQPAINNLFTNANTADFGNLKNGGFIKTLLLKIGARYMMTKNVDTSDGLVNGATGYLMKINYGRANITTNIKSSGQHNSGALKPLR